MSTSFRDTKNRTWHLSITTWHLKIVRERLGIELGRLLDDGLKPFAELVSDQVSFVNVLYLLCEDQCKAAGVTDEDFGRSLAGDEFEEAARAFQEAYLLFCPSRTREILTPLLMKARAATERAQAEMVKRAQEWDGTTTPSASNSPESAESIPPG